MRQRDEAQWYVLVEIAEEVDGVMFWHYFCGPQEASEKDRISRIKEELRIRNLRIGTLNGNVRVLPKTAQEIMNLREKHCFIPGSKRTGVPTLDQINSRFRKCNKAVTYLGCRMKALEDERKKHRPRIIISDFNQPQETVASTEAPYQATDEVA